MLDVRRKILTISQFFTDPHVLHGENNLSKKRDFYHTHQHLTSHVSQNSPSTRHNYPPITRSTCGRFHN
jgi:hypothetical protein